MHVTRGKKRAKAPQFGHGIFIDGGGAKWAKCILEIVGAADRKGLGRGA